MPHAGLGHPHAGGTFVPLAQTHPPAALNPPSPPPLPAGRPTHHRPKTHKNWQKPLKHFFPKPGLGAPPQGGGGHCQTTHPWGGGGRVTQVSSASMGPAKRGTWREHCKPRPTGPRRSPLVCPGPGHCHRVSCTCPEYSLKLSCVSQPLGTYVMVGPGPDWSVGGWVGLGKGGSKQAVL